MSILPVTAEWTLPMLHVGRRVLYYDELPSTMAVAAALASDPDNDGIVVQAGVQTAGRGQYGRSWLCPPGAGVLLGVLLFPPPARRRAAVLTAWAAVAVCETVEHFTGQSATIKWPNDVLLGTRKVCGILIEASAGPSSSAVVGIGLNVNQQAEEFAAAGLPDANSLAIVAGQTFDAPTVARHLIGELDRLYAIDLAVLEANWRDRIGLVGRTVTIHTAAGHVHHGRLHALTFDELVVESAGTEPIRLAPESVRQLSGK